MAKPKKFSLADFGADIEEIKNRADRRLFKNATITWGTPRVWRPEEDAPITEADVSSANVYAITRHHHLEKRRENIVYIGLSLRLQSRFNNHPKADMIRQKRGEVKLSIGTVSFAPWFHARSVKKSVEQIEHILIWALSPEYNDKKAHSLPGFGSNGASAWQICNKGYRFAGRLPLEIVFPWMIVRNGRDHSRRSLAR